MRGDNDVTNFLTNFMMAVSNRNNYGYISVLAVGVSMVRVDPVC